MASSKTLHPPLLLKSLTKRLTQRTLQARTTSRLPKSPASNLRSRSRTRVSQELMRRCTSAGSRSCKKSSGSGKRPRPAPHSTCSRSRDSAIPSKKTSILISTESSEPFILSRPTRCYSWETSAQFTAVVSCQPLVFSQWHLPTRPASVSATIWVVSRTVCTSLCPSC